MCAPFGKSLNLGFRSWSTGLVFRVALRKRYGWDNRESGHTQGRRSDSSTRGAPEDGEGGREGAAETWPSPLWLKVQAGCAKMRR